MTWLDQTSLTDNSGEWKLPSAADRGMTDAQEQHIKMLYLRDIERRERRKRNGRRWLAFFGVVGLIGVLFAGPLAALQLAWILGLVFLMVWLIAWGVGLRRTSWQDSR